MASVCAVVVVSLPLPPCIEGVGGGVGGEKAIVERHSSQRTPILMTGDSPRVTDGQVQLMTFCDWPGLLLSIALERVAATVRMSDRCPLI